MYVMPRHALSSIVNATRHRSLTHSYIDRNHLIVTPWVLELKKYFSAIYVENIQTSGNLILKIDQVDSDSSKG